MDCMEVMKANSNFKSGPYDIHPDGQSVAKAYCTDDAWTVIQARIKMLLVIYVYYAQCK